MNSILHSVRLTVVSLVGAGAIQVMAHEEQEMLVGRNATGEIIVDSDFEQPVELPTSIFPGISGYATGELAFHSTILDDPADDFFQLSPAANFRLVLLAKDPGMEVWNDTGTGFMGTNDTYFIGASPFDSHPIWNIVNGTPGVEYSLTLKMIDLNAVYSDSAPFVLNFTPVGAAFQINIEPIDSRNATLFWPTNAVDWELHATDSVTATNWSTVTNVPGVAGTNFFLNITTDESQQFFRLHKH